MPTLNLDVVAFDLDGTLADTAPDLAAALNHTLAALGRAPVPAESVRDLIGQGARALLRRGLATSGATEEALVERGYPIFLDFYGANPCVGTRPYAALEPVLDALGEAGVAIALCTNKPERLARALVDALGWRGRFASVIGGDSLSVRKPDPAPLRAAIARAGGGRAAFVGDSITDALTARAARVPFVAVGFGYCEGPVEGLDADAIIHTYGDLIAALERL